MYFIKEIILFNFKSYKGLHKFDTPLRNGFHAIVGRNGTGKSNLLQALEFLTCTKLVQNFSSTQTYGREECYVEITFGDVEQPEIDLKMKKRVILAKTEYFINDAKVSKSFFFISLKLKSIDIGTYQVIRHDTVSEFMKATPRERLVEVIMQIDKVNFSKYITYAQDKHNDYKKNFLAYGEAADKYCGPVCEVPTKKSKKDLRKLKASLTLTKQIILLKKTEKQKKKILDEMASSVNKVFKDEAINDQREFLIEEIDENLAICKKDLLHKKRNISKYQHDRDIIEIEIFNIKLKQDELKTEIKDLANVEGESNTKLEENMNVLHQWSKLKASLRDKKNDMDDRLKELENAKALKTQYLSSFRFTTKEEKDNWLLLEISRIDNEIRDKHTKLDLCETEYSLKCRMNLSLEEEITYYEGDLESYSPEDLRLELATLQCQLRDCQRSIMNAGTDVSKLKQEEIWHKTELIKKIGPAMFNGIESVKSVTKNGYDGYLGLVIDNVDFDDDYAVCLQAATGNQLFMNIVETHHIGSEILKKINEQNLPGAPYFMPLNILQFTERNLNETKDAKRITRVLIPKEKAHKAICYVFKNCMVCTSLKKAAEYSRRHDVKCVTLNGDRVEPMGSLSGGHIEKSKCSLLLYKKYSATVSNLEEKNNKLQELEIERNNLEQKMEQTLATLLHRQHLKSIAVSRLNQIKEAYKTEERLCQDLLARFTDIQKQIDLLKERKSYLQIKLDQELSEYTSQIEKKLIENNKQLFALEKSIPEIQLEIQALKGIMSLCEQKMSFQDKCTDGTFFELAKLNKKNYRDGQLSSRIALLTKELSDCEKSLANEKEAYEKISTHLKVLELKKQRVMDEHYCNVNDNANGTDNNLKEETLEMLNEQIAKYSSLISNTKNVKPLTEETSIEEINRKLKLIAEELNQFDKTPSNAIITNARNKLNDLIFQDNNAQEYINYMHEHTKQIIDNIASDYTSAFKSMTTFEAALVLSEKTDENLDLPYDGLNIMASFSGQSSQTYSNLRRLSRAQQTVIFLALQAAIMKHTSRHFIFLDEIDKFFSADPQPLKIFFAGVAKNKQVFAVTHKNKVSETADAVYKIEYGNNTSAIKSEVRYSQLSLDTSSSSSDFMTSSSSK